MTGALDGIRVLDLSRVIAGPYVSRLYADMGAEVIKVESPTGDDARWIAPPHDHGNSAHYTLCNVGKRSIALDLTKPGALDVVLDLVRQSHAVVENFRPGVLERLGLGWTRLKQVNPRVCLLSINGFGHDSQWAQRRAYAPIVHAVSGVLHDQAQYAGQPVTQFNDARADVTAALHGAVALLAALRAVDANGIGQHVEVPMLDALLAGYTEVGNELLEGPDDRVMNPIYDAGPHGGIAVAGAERYAWRLLSSHDAKLRDPAPSDADRDTKSRLRRATLEQWMAGFGSREELIETLEAAGLAVSPVVTLREALTGPIARERELLVEVDDRRGGIRRLVRAPARFSDAENRVRGPAPTLGEHDDEILRDVLGYPDERIETLRRDGALVAKT